MADDITFNSVQLAIKAAEKIIEGLLSSDLTLQYGRKPYEAIAEFKMDLATDILVEMGVSFDEKELGRQWAEMAKFFGVNVPEWDTLDERAQERFKRARNWKQQSL